MSKLGTYAAVILCIAVAIHCRTVLSPFLSAAAVAYILDMPVRFFERLLAGLRQSKLRRPMAILASLLTITALVVLFVSLLAPRISESAGMLYDQLPEYWDALCEYLEALPIPDVLHRIAAAHEFSLSEQLSQIGTTLFTHLWEMTRNTGGVIANSISDIFTTTICCLYMLFCKNSVLSQCKSLFAAVFPRNLFSRLHVLFELANEIFSKFISGRVIESIVLMLLCFLGLLLSGIPYAPLLSIIVGISNLIPFLGPLVGTVPCLLLLVVIDPIQALWFTVFIIALQQLDNNFISPRIVGTSVGLPAFWSMAAVLLGARLWGAAGAFLSVPCAAVLYRILSRQIRQRLSTLST